MYREASKIEATTKLGETVNVNGYEYIVVGFSDHSQHTNTRRALDKNNIRGTYYIQKPKGKTLFCVAVSNRSIVTSAEPINCGRISTAPAQTIEQFKSSGL